LIKEILGKVIHTLLFFKKASRPQTKSKSVTKADPYRPEKVSLDFSTHCQLNCVSCPTATRLVKKGIGSGFLSFDHFRRFTRENPRVKKIEISNWGEPLLNPEFVDMLEWAFRNGISLSIDNGANLNLATDEVLEALVKYQVQRISCSIDGASQETYSIYRINGDFNRVIKNITRINQFKEKYRSIKPKLTWQFVVFGHNEHEIGIAREMASELGMKFKLKLSWDDMYAVTFSPVKNRELIMKETGMEVATRKEYEDSFGENYAGNCCLNLWHSPNINFDGKLLGCCVNHWADFGNVFEEGLEKCLRSERYEYAKEMLLGVRPERDDIPCIRCRIYATRKEHGSFVTEKQLAERPHHSG